MTLETQKLVWQRHRRVSALYAFAHSALRAARGDLANRTLLLESVRVCRSQISMLRSLVMLETLRDS